jgi:hypothetical protein
MTILLSEIVLGILLAEDLEEEDSLFRDICRRPGIRRREDETLWAQVRGVD